MSGSNQSSGAASVGQEDQRDEKAMEDEQRREDEGIGVPPIANPHAQVNSIDQNQRDRKSGSQSD